MSVKLFISWILLMFGVIYCADLVMAAETVLEATVIAKEVPAAIPPELWSELISNISKSMGVDNFLATYLAVMAGLRILAEGGGIIANKTSTQFDNKAVQWFAKALSAISWAAGVFGIGTPKNTTKPQFKKGA